MQSDAKPGASAPLRNFRSLKSMGAASTIAVRAVWLLQFKTIRQKKGQTFSACFPIPASARWAAAQRAVDVFDCS